MMTSVSFEVTRNIKFLGKTIQGDTADFTDKQTVSCFSRRVEVAAKEPNAIVQNWKIPMLANNNAEYFKEKNRFLQIIDLETGQNLPMEMKTLQHQMLPTMDTEMIKVSYEITCVILHDTAFKDSQCLPTVTLPLTVTLDPQGVPIMQLASSK